MTMSSQLPVVNITSDLIQTQFSEVIKVELICRLCTNQSDKLIGIYSGEGVSNDLAGKLNLYLPIKVAETDQLPLQCCWQCASTVLAWHDLVIISAEADRRLRSYQLVNETQFEEIPKSYEGNGDGTAVGTEESMVAVDKQINTSYTLIDGGEILIEANLAEISTDSDKKSVSDYDPYVPEDKDGTEISRDGIKQNKEASEVSEDEEGEQEGSIIYKYECLNCPMLFFNKQDVMNHIRETHSGDFAEGMEVTTKKECSEADLETARLGHRRRNIKHQTKHPVPKIDQKEVNKAKVIVDGRTFYRCKECGKTLHSVYTYGWHMRIHTGERPYECNLCGKTFRVSQGLMKHVKETHERIKNFACDLCDRNFTTKRNVEEHRRIHTNERPYICATCGKSFKQRASLFVHNRSHSEEFPFACPECPQKFRTKPILMLHATKHTGEKPFPCDVCGRHFRIKYELKRHKLIHSDDKPFKCRMCEQTFKQKRYLRNHLKLNHNLWDVGALLAEYSNAS